MFSKEIVEEIKSRSDIVKYLEDQGIALRVSGANLLGLCPFHNERSPSFNVRPGIQRFHCFGCGENGDIVNLVEHFESLNFTGAILYLADELGIQVVSDEDDEEYKRLKRLHTICKVAADYFHQNFLELPDQHPAKLNLDKRRLLEFAQTDESIGYAPNNGLIKLLLSHRFSLEEIITAGLAKAPNPDLGQTETREVFRNRLMWTIYDITGKPVGFSGRKVYENDTVSPKYVNSPQTPLYNKSKALLGLHFARKSIVENRSVYVVEGQTDVMALQAAEVTNVVASCGTAFGKVHAEILERLAATSTKKKDQFRFLFCFDGDAAGIKAAKSVFLNIPEIQLNSYVVNMSVKKGDNLVTLDPCDMREEYGDDVLRDSLQNPISMLEFILKQELSNWDIITPEGRSGFVNAARPTLALIKDPLAHDAYLRKISYWTGVPYTQLVDLIRKPANKTQSSMPANSNSNQDLTIDERVYAAYMQFPAQMKELLRDRGINMSHFDDPARATEVFDGKHDPGDLLLFADLKIRPGDEFNSLERTVEMFLKLKYLEATEQLNARIAAMSNDAQSLTDETILFEILKEQEDLKKRFRQLGKDKSSR